MSIRTNLPNNPNVEIIKANESGIFTNCIFKAIPVAFDESMSYYETLCGLLYYLKNVIIPTVNNNADAVAELQVLYEQLRSYVDNYFTNLDVQEEINNKLDEMVESGEFQNILTNKLKLTRIYNTTEEMINDKDNLYNNQIIKTLGYYSVNDGGGAYFYITNDTNTPNYQIELGNGLFARIINDKINVMQFGAKGDGINNDTTYLKTAIEYAKSNDMQLISPSNKTYLINETLEINNINMNFNDSTIKAINNINIITINTTDYYGLIENLTLDCENANCGIMITNGRKKTFTNIKFINISKYGFYFENGYEILLKDSHFQGNGTNLTTGLYLDSGDSKFENIILIDCYKGIYNNSLNFFEYIHGWILTPDILDGSIFFHIDGSTSLLNQCYSDTYYITINQSRGHININQMYVFFNQNIYTLDKEPYFFYLDGITSNNRSSVENSSINGAFSNKKIIFSNYPGTCKVNNNNLVWVKDYKGGIIYTPTPTSDGIEIITNSCVIKNGVMHINLLFTLDTAITNTFSFSNLPVEYRPIGKINSVCGVSKSQYSFSNENGYLFIYDKISGSIPDDNTKWYVKIQMSYTIQNENY